MAWYEDFQHWQLELSRWAAFPTEEFPPLPPFPRLIPKGATGESPGLTSIPGLVSTPAWFIPTSVRANAAATGSEQYEKYSAGFHVPPFPPYGTYEAPTNTFYI